MAGGWQPERRQEFLGAAEPQSGAAWKRAVIKENSKGTGSRPGERGRREEETSRSGWTRSRCLPFGELV